MIIFNFRYNAPHLSNKVLNIVGWACFGFFLELEALHPIARDGGCFVQVHFPTSLIQVHFPTSLIQVHLLTHLVLTLGMVPCPNTQDNGAPYHPTNI